MRKILSVLMLLLSMQVMPQGKILDRGEIRLPEKLTGLNTYTPPVSIKIRCASTVRYEEPLWIIDGIVHEAPVRSLDPSTIDSIWILKSAGGVFSCYETQRGVIVITTKKRVLAPVTKNQKQLTPVAALNVYPNPLPVGHPLTVKTNQFNNNFYLRVVSLEGKIVQMEKCNATKVMIIQPEGEWKPGSYFIQYLDDKMSLVASSQVIMQ